MKRSIKKLIIALIVLAVLGGGYFLAVRWDPDKNDENEDDGLASETAYIINKETEDVESVEFHSEDFSYKIINGSDGAKIEGYTSVLISESSLESALSESCYIMANKELKERAENLSEYGLEAKNKYITLNMKDGSSETVIIGSDAYIGNSIYAMRESDCKIYTVSSYKIDSLMKSPDEYRQMSVCSIDNTLISSITIYNGKTEILSIKKDEEANDNSDENTAAMIQNYSMIYPYKMKASSDRVMGIIEKIGSITASEIVEENPSDLSKYGLSSPITVIIKDSEKEHKISIGAKKDGNYFMMYNDVLAVYLAPCDFYDAVRSARANDFIDRFVHIFDISKVKEIMLEKSGEKHTFSINGDTSKDGGAEYKIDGKKTTEDKFKKVYQAIIGITFNDVVEFTPAGNACAVISFEFNDGTSKSYTYYPYNERYVYVKAENGLGCITLEKNITEILNSIN